MITETYLTIVEFFTSGEYLNWLVLFFAIPFYTLLILIDDKLNNN